MSRAHPQGAGRGVGTPLPRSWRLPGERAARAEAGAGRAVLPERGGAHAQPPLSRAIRRVEATLGVALLERTTRQVTLTAAGQVLLEQARAALDAVAAADAYWSGRDPESLAAVPAQPQPVTAEPRVLADRPVVHDIAQLLQVVALGQGVAFLPVSVARQYARRDLASRPVSGLSPSTVAVAWPETSRSLAVAAFVRAATTLSQTHPEQTAALV